ncbi:hypothetical protein BABINDRAFT_163875 [Babjeviella inositovora NRRL Y-12698]|uniref:NADPH-dependent 1-acyldihydroxyacetone phosphate reductase n=1 Tax=Babjeviella inositovora NRRL Y-12698 TaxID=984486 RepID=A0A1E3QHN6_9ASCO|nr:uncharacterized protein BABINDRAFT_163875 [Babjeviella inositovora NRRL Y-12698]ODQ77150.1 hypothetical protein BABINDRAFT_163875 [Babjeviella inositovora NRRL Y-12698]
MPEQKTAVITGASSGIGYAASIEMAKRGYQVYACARRLEPMEELKKYGVKIFTCDVTDLESVKKAKAYVEKETNGKLDVLYNNAGQACTIPAIDATDEQALQCFQANVLGPVRMTREFSSLLIEAKGIIVFTGSVAGDVPLPWGSIYGATKAAIHQFAAVLHLEMKPFGVRVLNVVTGGVKTNIADNRPFPETSVYACAEFDASITEMRQKVSKNHPMSAEVYAKKVVDDIESSSNRLNVYRGAKATAASILMAIVPRFIIEMIISVSFKLLPLEAALQKKFSKKAD